MELEESSTTIEIMEEEEYLVQKYKREKLIRTDSDTLIE